MRKRPCAGSARERGQAMVETALSMMIVLVLLAGMVDFGIAFGYRVALDNASRGGARFGSRYPNMPNLITNAVVDSLKGTLVLSSTYDHIASPDPHLHIAIACMNGATAVGCNAVVRGQQIRVTVGYDYQTLFVGLLGISELPISTSTTMYVLGPDEPGG
jgi:Flp pilus assembly protein TadG